MEQDDPPFDTAAVASITLSGAAWVVPFIAPATMLSLVIATSLGVVGCGVGMFAFFRAESRRDRGLAIAGSVIGALATAVIFFFLAVLDSLLAF